MGAVSATPDDWAVYEWGSLATPEVAAPPPAPNGTALPADAFPLLSFDDLLRRPDPPWLVDGLVPVGLSILYGPSGSGKSFLALDWAACVATGKAWHGHAVRPGWVVYVAAEGVGGLKARVWAWWVAHDRPDMSRIRWLPEAVNLRDRYQVERARRTLASLPERPALLVIDTMARTMVGGDENAAKDVGEFIAAVDGLRAADAALVIHHSAKADGAAERGSSALRGAADLMARVKRDGKSPRLTLTCEKLKDSGEWPDLGLRLEPAEGSCVLSRVVGAPDDLPDRVRAFVAEHGPVSTRGVREGVRGRGQAVDEALRGLEAAGGVVRSSDRWEACPGAPDTLGHAPPTEDGGGVSGQGGKTPKGSPAGTRPAPCPPDPCPDPPDNDAVRGTE